MRRLFTLPLLAAATSLATPLTAQQHDHSVHAMPAQPEPEPDHSAMDHSAHTAPTQPDPEPDHSAMDHSAHTAPTQPDPVSDHSAMDHSAHPMPAQPEPAPDHSAMDHGAMDHGAMDHAAMGHAMPIANSPPASGPPPRALQGPAHAADELYGTAAMQPARAQLYREMGGRFRTASLMVERFEARLGDEDGYLWDLQGFIGGDLDRLVVKSEGEGAFDGGAVEDAEIQALWGHAIGPFIDLQAGARLDLEPDTRAHAVIGVQGLAPYMIHFDAAAFLSDRGDLTARIEAEYDQKITQRLILQPRVEIDLSAQEIAERGTGSGITSLAAGLRLRYEILPELAPYVGVEWEGALGKTRDLIRAAGEDAAHISVLVGLRFWF